MKYKAVIFDMDGTLLNTIEDITDSVNFILRKYQMPERTLDEIKHFVGNSAVKLIERAIVGGKENPLFDKILSDYEAYYVEHCNIKTGPYEHIVELLRELKKRGYKVAIVSNKSMDGVQELKNVYFNGLADVAVGVTEDLNRKPAPDECLEAMRLLAVDKKDCVYVGDSDVDHMTALNTGIPCISCLWGFRTKEELIEAGAGSNAFVSDPLEILDLV
ncbi:MAG: HAD family hydrolase [Butyrivibrio sp.]|uniref:HAD family hydrolase n=1 Tax=Butyrivibrio sp. TaxID=28121 RepID=UPI001B288321|nr:HAD family hydrolase [Butyrivibrio sp.]MBO6241045.1 HAD family hydrolase [Butyrivibrio sp.]